jgi:hypothetical protein
MCIKANSGYQITCPLCGNHFYICKSCYRGHVYCSKDCSKEGRRLSKKIANKKYRKSLKGIKKQAAQSRKYFIQKNKNKNNARDQSSHNQPVVLTPTCVDTVELKIKTKEPYFSKEASLNPNKLLVNIRYNQKCIVCETPVIKIITRKKYPQYISYTVQRL